MPLRKTNILWLVGRRRKNFVRNVWMSHASCMSRQLWHLHILNWRDESKDLTWSNKRIVSKTISICKNDSYNTNKKIKYTFLEHLNMELDTSNQLQATTLVFFSTIQPYLIWGTLIGLLDTSNSKTEHKFYANFINYYRSGYG